MASDKKLASQKSHEAGQRGLAWPGGDRLLHSPLQPSAHASVRTCTHQHSLWASVWGVLVVVYATLHPQFPFSISYQSLRDDEEQKDELIVNKIRKEQQISMKWADRSPIPSCFFFLSPFSKRGFDERHHPHPTSSVSESFPLFSSSCQARQWCWNESTPVLMNFTFLLANFSLPASASTTEGPSFPTPPEAE